MTIAAQIAVPTAEAIEQLLIAARARADALGARVNVAVVDAGGNLAGFIRMPGAFISSVDLAIDKAYTAASFSLSTRAFGTLLEGAKRSVRDGLLRRPRLTEVPGGLPLEFEGAVIGAIGISGGSVEQDEEIASHALAALISNLQPENG